jgi:putative tryptophan/tyrosine transport system substrate-binding protein
LELLKEAVPHLSRVALVFDRTDQFKERTLKAHQAAAEALGISLWSVEIASPDDIEPVFAKVAEDRANGVVWAAGGLLFVQRARMGATNSRPNSSSLSISRLRRRSALRSHPRCSPPPTR